MMKIVSKSTYEIVVNAAIRVIQEKFLKRIYNYLM